MSDDTIRTRALTFGRSHWKMVAAWVIACASTLVNISIAIGHRQSDSAVVAASVTQLVSKVDGLTDKVNTQSADIAGMTAKVDMIHEDVNGIKAWKDGIKQDVKAANEVNVPKFQSHRRNARQ